MSAYYNEHDKFAAAWLRELIKAGLIADGEVDERDIQDVTAADLERFTQCHFFAGIGGWSYALRLAGWPDDRPVWTGSCPCQPFSTAGAREGGRDDRHLWPHWARLIRECRPVAVFGEQVESAIAHGWLDAVSDDLEREGYACGAACVPAASVGAPHIRQRIWFVADRISAGQCGADQSRGAGLWDATERRGGPQRVAQSSGSERGSWGRRWPETGGAGPHSELAGSGDVGDVGDPDLQGPQGRVSRQLPERAGERTPWAASDFIDCRDGKRRPVEPGTFPLVAGLSKDMVRGGDPSGAFDANATSEARVGRLRGYGNAIVPQVAAEVVRAYMEIQP